MVVEMSGSPCVASTVAMSSEVIERACLLIETGRRDDIAFLRIHVLLKTNAIASASIQEYMSGRPNRA